MQWKRVAPLIAVTMPIGRFSASSTGPCSICNSTKAATLRPRSVATASGSQPKLVSASRMVTPSASFWSSDERANRPAKAREPVSVVGKRTPSSSPNATISTATSSRSSLFDELLDHRERGERAEVAVIAAGVAHGVDMRADHQRRRARLLAFVTRPDIARGVDLCGKADLARTRRYIAGRLADARWRDRGASGGLLRR